ncbi:unnamed protein product [Parascedosporium putredinis]|uniref:Metallo-beta-lactamase domain-containing protein n=1 Tax=Parascedosporium putredinis TaxID=1442378 RepID=A0A9P1H805_9PEZI|nr:unnamed protein product [Parascedosporium putredinis]CAI8000168.1 unnamed protein product [Parascedosporium putredinis]
MAFEPSFEDRQDFADAERGFIDKLEPGIIKNAAGEVVWNIDQFKFLEQECPATANPNLWRQGQLNSKQGLFEICPGIYQIRAFDLSNISIVEGKEGIIIIDPLVSCECAAAALAIYEKHRGKRKVTGMIYSHSHGDHYMGALGVIPADAGDSIPIIAPEGFIEAVMSESIMAGPSMRRRGAYMYGRELPRSAEGHIGVGLGMGSSTGLTSLILPNTLIQKTGDELVVDGVRIVFQMVPGSEAPAEINFHFPEFKALCIPETATNCMHNIVTLRGAQVRDAKAWSGYLDEAIVMFGEESDVLFGSHNWPTWGKAELTRRLEEQRDMYGYMHDQTLRMMNLGMTGVEIAERIQLPPAIQKAWHCRGFYGSLSHNVKCMGGVEKVCTLGQNFIDAGDARFAATLLDHAYAAEPADARVKDLLATAYEKLGYGAENATWRNFYLVAAQELRTGKGAGMIGGGSTPLGPTLTVGQWFDVMSIQLDGERAVGESFAIDFDVVDVKERWRLVLSNGTLHKRDLNAFKTAPASDANLTLRMDKAELLEVLRGKEAGSGQAQGMLGFLPS